MIIMNQFPLIQCRVARPHLHSQHVYVRLHVVKAVHLVEHSEHVRVLAAQHGVLIEVHGRREEVIFVVGYLDEAATLWGELVPFGFRGVEGGLRLVVRVVAVVFEEFLLGMRNWTVLVVVHVARARRLAGWYEAVDFAADALWSGLSVQGLDLGCEDGKEKEEC